ncbi:MAG: right-handed parallel beta-helix repeat-containing protein [Chloroflexota bacterium]|nr:right-handed parallel beta-helix repeat-containing protein [Chloroflexota bacterium]
MRYPILLTLFAALALAGCNGVAQPADEFRPPSAETPILQADALPAAGTTHFVSPHGDDGHAGTFEKPWRTLQHASDSVIPGDTVQVRGGRYSENVIIYRSGAIGLAITFTNRPGETVILDGRNQLYAAFELADGQTGSQVSDIVISGFTIQNYTGFGIVAWDVNDRLTLRDLVILDNGDTGIRLSNSDGSVVRNVLLQNNEGGFDCTPVSPGGERAAGCTNLVIADVQAIDNGTAGGTATDAFAVERGADILVERSLAAGGVGDGFDFKSDRTVLRQVVAHDTRNNIKLWGEGSTVENALAYDATADANVVLTAGGSYTLTNVTVANMAGTAYLVVAGDLSGSGPTPLRLTNSIFYNDNPANQGTLFWLSPEVRLAEESNNIFYNPYRTDDVICAGFSPFDGQCFGSDEINGGVWPYSTNSYDDPLFLDPEAKDFHLMEQSPAVDGAAARFSPAVDLDGNSRGEHPDIGAYEFLSP